MQPTCLLLVYGASLKDRGKELDRDSILICDRTAALYQKLIETGERCQILIAAGKWQKRWFRTLLRSQKYDQQERPLREMLQTELRARGVPESAIRLIGDTSLWSSFEETVAFYGYIQGQYLPHRMYAVTTADHALCRLPLLWWLLRREEPDRSVWSITWIRIGWWLSRSCWQEPAKLARDLYKLSRFKKTFEYKQLMRGANSGMRG